MEYIKIYKFEYFVLNEMIIPHKKYVLENYRPLEIVESRQSKSCATAEATGYCSHQEERLISRSFIQESESRLLKWAKENELFVRSSPGSEDYALLDAMV